MKKGNIYLVTYKEYRNDPGTFQVKVFARDSVECELKIKKAGLIHYTDIFANNSGYIDSIELIESDVL